MKKIQSFDKNSNIRNIYDRQQPPLFLTGREKKAFDNETHVEMSVFYFDR